MQEIAVTQLSVLLKEFVVEGISAVLLLTFPNPIPRRALETTDERRYLLSAISNSQKIKLPKLGAIDIEGRKIVIYGTPEEGMDIIMLRA